MRRRVARRVQWAAFSARTIVPERACRAVMAFTRGLRRGGMIRAVLALRLVTAMFAFVRTLRAPITFAAARLAAVLPLDHRAQFLHLPRERANLIVHRLQRRASGGCGVAPRRKRRASRSTATALSR